MMYRNESDKPVWASVRMTRRRVQPGETIILSASDVKNSGFAMARLKPATDAKPEPKQSAPQPQEPEITSPPVKEPAKEESKKEASEPEPEQETTPDEESPGDES